MFEKINHARIEAKTRVQNWIDRHPAVVTVPVMISATYGFAHILSEATGLKQVYRQMIWEDGRIKGRIEGFNAGQQNATNIMASSRGANTPPQV